MNSTAVPAPGNHYKPWRDGEDRKLREFADAGLGARAIGRRLGRTTVAIRTRAVHLGIRLGGAPANGDASGWQGDEAVHDGHAAPPAVDGETSAGAMVRVVSLTERARETVAASAALRQHAASTRLASRPIQSA